MDTIKELTKEELCDINGGIIFSNFWEALGYFLTLHAMDFADSGYAPSALAYK